MSYKPVALTYDDQNFKFYIMITFYVIMQDVNVEMEMSRYIITI